MGHEVYNYGMYTAEDECQLTYVQAGILAAVLLNSGAADYVITGCGTGEGAMLACNSFPGVICGHVEDALDACVDSLIRQIRKNKTKLERRLREVSFDEVFNAPEAEEEKDEDSTDQ